MVDGFTQGGAAGLVAQVALEEAAVLAKRLGPAVAGEPLEGWVDVDQRHVGLQGIGHAHRERCLGLERALHDEHVALEVAQLGEVTGDVQHAIVGHR